MAMKKKGFALLIAVIFMSVMLTFGLALGSLAYKQGLLSSGAIESQHAFYAADAAMECTLYYDQKGSFAYPPAPSTQPSVSCSGQTPAKETMSTGSFEGSSYLLLSYQLKLDSSKYCADVTIYKYNPPLNGTTTKIFAQGYSASCAAIGSGSGFSSRGLEVRY